MTKNKLPTTEQIEQRAYELYLERGGESGRDVDDWLAAERELSEVSEQSILARLDHGLPQLANKHRFVLLKPPHKGQRKTAGTKAGASPVPKVCQNAMFFEPLGLALSEKQIPQIAENTEK